jgi:hypothetical protein
LEVEGGWRPHESSCVSGCGFVVYYGWTNDGGVSVRECVSEGVCMCVCVRARASWSRDKRRGQTRIRSLSRSSCQKVCNLISTRLCKRICLTASKR